MQHRNRSRTFEGAATQSLSQWRFNPGSGERHDELDVDFKR